MFETGPNFQLQNIFLQPPGENMFKRSFHVGVRGQCALSQQWGPITPICVEPSCCGGFCVRFLAGRWAIDCWGDPAAEFLAETNGEKTGWVSWERRRFHRSKRPDKRQPQFGALFPKPGVFQKNINMELLRALQAEEYGAWDAELFIFPHEGGLFHQSNLQVNRKKYTVLPAWQLVTEEAMRTNCIILYLIVMSWIAQHNLYLYLS